MGNGYGENLDFSGGTVRWGARTGSTVIGPEKKLYRERNVSQVAGVAVEDGERVMRTG